VSRNALLRHRRDVRGDRTIEQTPTTAEFNGLEALLKDSERQLGQFVVQVIRDRALAEDVLQETLLVALEHRAELGSMKNPRAWLFGVARNRALQALRRGRRARAALDRLVRPRDDPPDLAEAVAIRDSLVRALPPDDRMLIVLRYVHGFKAADLAAMTGRSTEAVRQRLSRARRRLLAVLDADDVRNSSGDAPGGERDGRDH
jgi:RNA polymerase sigma-70 factor, ECF subfamily